MKGKRRTIYITREADDRMTELGIDIADVVAAGLAALEAKHGHGHIHAQPGEPDPADLGFLVPDPVRPQDCKHPKARRDGKNPALCRACGAIVR